jgi:hypothetical protein
MLIIELRELYHICAKNASTIIVLAFLVYGSTNVKDVHAQWLYLMGLSSFLPHYDLLKERATGQLNQADGLNSKANNIRVAASAILAVALLLESAILTLQIHALSLDFT